MLVLAGALITGSTAGGAPTLADLERHISEAARLTGEPSVLERAGVTNGDRPLFSLESGTPRTGTQRRVALLGGLDGDERGVEATLGAVRWFKNMAPESLRRGWSLVVIPCGNPEGWEQAKPTNNYFGKPAVNYPPENGFFQDPKNVEARYLWRWIQIQAPDLVVEIRAGRTPRWLVPPTYSAGLGAALKAQPLVSADSLPMALSRGMGPGLGPVPAVAVEARPSDGPRILEMALQAAAGLGPSPLRQAMSRRQSRSPLEVARILSGRYPQQPAIQYIPAVAWAGRLRLAERVNDPALTDKVKAEVLPYLNGEKPALVGPPDGPKLAGHLIFAELALRGDAAARKLALDAAALFRPEQDSLPARHGRFWTDDLFFSAALLTRASRLSGEGWPLDLACRTLEQYAARLQQPTGVFHHAPDAPHAWGRGNGFALLGMMETLTQLPPAHPRRAAILQIFRKQVAGLRSLQSPEGAWRQVIDRPESYREVTATAMTLAALARGVRLGWLDSSYRPVVDRAWEALTARIAEDGSLLDVCEGTGAGPTRRYYLERKALQGPDDRGGALCLLATLELLDLREPPNAR